MAENVIMENKHQAGYLYAFQGFFNVAEAMKIIDVLRKNSHKELI